MQAVYCLDCARSIQVSDIAQVGDSVVCPHCTSAFEVIVLDPIDIEWISDTQDFSQERHFSDGVTVGSHWANSDIFDDDFEDAVDENWSYLIAKQQRIQQSEDREAPRRPGIPPATRLQSGYSQHRQRLGSRDW